MNKRESVLDVILNQGVLPLYFHPDAHVSVHVLKSLYRGGIRAVEYTNRGASALENFLHLKKITERELPGLLLGVGTIKNKIEATEFINEGADFVICPGVIEEVATLAHRNDLLWIPGCMTSTEIIIAEDLGATLIKLFPGNFLGPSYISALKEIFPDLLFMPTGGVEANRKNISEWFNAGASVVGLGSNLISKNLMATKDYSSLQLQTTDVLQIIKEVRTTS